MAKNNQKNGKNRNGAGFAALIAGVMLLLGGGAWGTGVLPGSNGIGNGENNNPTTTVTSTPADNTDKNNQTERTIIILLDQSTITVNGETCESVEAMNSKIKALYNENSKTEFEFQENYSIKSKYDEVISALKTVESILNIQIKGVD